MNFNGYKPVEQVSQVIPNGRYDAKILEALETTAGGVQALQVHIQVKGFGPGFQPDTITIFERPADEKRQVFWDYDMTRFFDSFGITRGDWNYKGWAGKYGTVDVTQDWNKKAGRFYARLHAVRKNDAPTEDYRPKDQTAPAETGPAVQDGFSDDIPF